MVGVVAVVAALSHVYLWPFTLYTVHSTVCAQLGKYLYRIIPPGQLATVEDARTLYYVIHASVVLPNYAA